MPGPDPALSRAQLSWRPLEAGDLERLATWLAEPGVARWWQHDSGSRLIARAVTDTWTSHPDDPLQYVFRADREAGAP